jgi:hypothetical protein
MADAFEVDRHESAQLSQPPRPESLERSKPLGDCPHSGDLPAAMEHPLWVDCRCCFIRSPCLEPAAGGGSPASGRSRSPAHGHLLPLVTVSLGAVRREQAGTHQTSSIRSTRLHTAPSPAARLGGNVEMAMRFGPADARPTFRLTAIVRRTRVIRLAPLGPSGAAARGIRTNAACPPRARCPHWAPVTYRRPPCGWVRSFGLPAQSAWRNP